MKSKRNLYKVFAMMLAVIMMMTTYSASAFAEGVTDETESDYIIFTSSPTRMASDGTFEFTFNKVLQSNYFIVNSTSVTINTRACVYDKVTGAWFNDASQKFYLKLYHKGTNISEYVGGYYGCANDVYGGVTFNNLKKGDKYFFQLTTDEALKDSRYAIKGSGKVSPVTVLYI